eukprot:215660_1
MALLKSTTTQTLKLDLSNMIDQLDDYEEGKTISFPVEIDNLTVDISVCPRPVPKAFINYKSGKSCLICVRMVDVNANDNRLFWCEMKCGTQTRKDVEYVPVKSITRGSGWLFPRDCIKRYKQVSIAMELNHNISAKSVKLSLFDQ